MAPVLPSNLFGDTQSELQRQLEERRKKMLAASQLGSPGQISNMMGYLGNTTGVPKI